MKTMFGNAIKIDMIYQFFQEETLCVILFLLFHILHFAIYYIDLKMHLRFIITKNGIIKKVDKIVYLLPWEFIIISETIIKDKYIFTNFWGKKINEISLETEEKQDIIFCDKIFRFQKDYSILPNKEFIQERYKKKILRILGWQKNNLRKNQDMHVQKISHLKYIFLITKVSVAITIMYYIPIILALLAFC